MTPINVFVMLPRHLDVSEWQERWSLGSVPDQTPYGYHFAAEMGATITYSRPTHNFKGVWKIADKLVKSILGFDLRHAWNNRSLIIDQRVQVVWTHTEYECLSIAALRILLRKPGAPLVGQTIWLVDGWSRFSNLKKQLYRYLLSKIAVATFLSPENKALAQKLGIVSEAEIVHFGISSDRFPLKTPKRKCVLTRPIRVLALGNDRHRDWVLLFDAFAGRPEYQVTIGTSTWPKSLKADNFVVKSLSQAEIDTAYESADVVVVPLKENLHASGITAILEAVTFGVPVVATRTGGLQDYLDPNAVTYFDLGDATGLRNSVSKLVSTPSLSYEQIVEAQQQFIERDLTTRGFAFRHMVLSRKLIKAFKK